MRHVFAKHREFVGFIVYFTAERHVDVQCPLHIHYYLEFVYVSEGEVVLTVSGQERRLTAGQATFIMPFERHSFFTAKRSGCLVIVFSPEMVADFYEMVKGRSVVTELFKPDAGTMEFCENVLSQAPVDTVAIKAALYPLCRDIRNNCEFSSAGRALDKTFVEAVRYVQQQLETGAVTLTATAKALNIHSVYLSRLFTQNCGMSFTGYVNLLRCTYAAEKIRGEKGRTFSEIAYEVGFGSIRNFNRTFLSCFGMTPKDYRKR